MYLSERPLCIPWLTSFQNAINEAAASNHEAHKLEEDVGRIATAVQQSELAAKSKLSALEVECVDFLRTL
jgi:hypothetical protein